MSYITTSSAPDSVRLPGDRYEPVDLDPSREPYVPPGAQVPPAKTEYAASMDAQGNVRLEATLGPQDRAVLRQVAQDGARGFAQAIGSPAGLRGLFPTNRSRLVHPKQKAARAAKEA